MDPCPILNFQIGVENWIAVDEPFIQSNNLLEYFERLITILIYTIKDKDCDLHLIDLYNQNKPIKYKLVWNDYKFMI